MKADTLAAVACAIAGGVYPSSGYFAPSTPRPLSLEGPLNGGGPCPVEQVRRGTRKTRRQRKKEKDQ